MPLLISYSQLLDLLHIVFTVLGMSEELPGAPLKCTVSPAVLSILT